MARKMKTVKVRLVCGGGYTYTNREAVMKTVFEATPWMKDKGVCIKREALNAVSPHSFFDITDGPQYNDQGIIFVTGEYMEVEG